MEITRIAANPNEAEAAANRETHSFFYTGSEEDMDIRCDGCDSRPSSRAMDWPCGSDVPRETFTSTRTRSLGA